MPRFCRDGQCRSTRVRLQLATIRGPELAGEAIVEGQPWTAIRPWDSSCLKPYSTCHFG